MRNKISKILIPSVVKAIKKKTFYQCMHVSTAFLGAFYRRSHLTSVVFSDEVEEFVSEDSIRDW